VTRTEKTYYLVVALWNVPGWFMHPVYPMFLASRGLDLFEVNLILAIFLISVFLLEVPTGAIADLYGRKFSFLASCATRMLAFVLYSFADGFAACAIAEVIDAVGLTLASGALEAWAVDGVRAEGDHRPADRMFARAQAIVRGSMVVGGVLCGYLADRFGLSLPWLVAAAFFGVAFAVGWKRMYDDRPARSAVGRTAEARSAARMAALALSAVRSHAVMRMICLLTMAFAFVVLPVAITWPPHMKQLTGEGFWLLGWIWALLSLAAVVGSSMVPFLLRRLRREQLLFGIALGRGAALAAAAVATAFEPTLAFLLVFEVMAAAHDPVMGAWMNEHVEADLRATVLSVRGMAFTLGGSLGLVCLGLIARGASIPTAWAAAAATALLLAPGYLLLGRIARTERRETPASVAVAAD
jgi:MFS family permease